MMSNAELRAMWDEACALATGGKKAKYVQATWHAVEYLLPLTDDAGPILIRCRTCQSITMVAPGPGDSMPDSNQGAKYTHFDSPCGKCRTCSLPPGWTLLGIRERYAKGGRIGLGA